MKIKNTLTAALALLTLLAGRLPASAQTFTTLANPSYLDGGPFTAGLVLSGNTLYGSAESNGTNGVGTIFSEHTDGSGFTNLYTFTPLLGPNGTNVDGAYPYGGLVLAGGTLYGTTYRGGKGTGTIFKVNTDGRGFTNLYVFNANTNSAATNGDGGYPQASLLLAGATLYGTAWGAGTLGNGTVFAINTNGSSFTNLHNFSLFDGTHPSGNLILAGQMLYGSANNGGTYGAGSVFGLTTNGTSFTNLYSFTAPAGTHSTNADGAFLGGGLVLANNILYGTANSGGFYGNGTIFGVSTNGTGFTNLHSFSFTSGSPATNGDGANPDVGLLLSGGHLYGATYSGGSAGNGTLFEMGTNGMNYSILHEFTALASDTNGDGANPDAALILSGNVLYGTAYRGGGYGYGTVFSLVGEPTLAITSAGTNVTLLWPTNLAGFTLQFNTNLAATGVWSNLLTAPVISSTNYSVTDVRTNSRRFYRLIQ